MTRISHSHVLGASKRLPPRITLLASSNKFKFKEERKRILKLSVKKLRSIEDPEAFLSKSVLINNTLKRLQTEVREEKAERKKCAELPDYSPSPYSFYSIEKAYREEMERLDNNGNNPDSTSSFGAAVAAAAALSANHQSAAAAAQSNNSSTNSEPSAYVSLHAQTCDNMDQHMLDADDEDSGSGADSSTSSTSGDSSSSEDEECEEISDTISASPDRSSRIVSARIEESSALSSAAAASLSASAQAAATPSIANENSNANSAVSINEMNSVEDDLLSEVYMPTPSMPPPHDPIDDPASGLEPCNLGVPMRPSTPVPWSSNNQNKSGGGSGVSKLLTNNPSAEAVIKSSEISGCDNEDIWSEAVRTECWTKPVDTPAPSSVSIRTTLTASSTVNTNSMSHHWPSVDWPTYTPSTGGPCSAVSESASGHSANSSTPIAALSASNNSAVATSAASNFNPNISALPISMQCANSHKENLFSATVHTTSSNQNLASNHNQNSSSVGLDMSCDRSKANPSPPAPSSLSDKCYSCGQSSLFQSELQSVVFSSLIASLET